MATRLLSAQPDAVLCRLAARGNTGAYDALYQRYRQPVFAFVYHLIGGKGADEDAEDIAQDAFTRAFAGIREKDVDGSFRAWLYTIARNRTYDHLRRRRQNVVSLDAGSTEPPAAPSVDQPAERAEQRAEFVWLMSAVADLPERQREALLLREMAGFSHEQIADELGTSVSATKKLISRGRDGIGEAAIAGGFSRPSRRKLGNDLAMAAPVLPLTFSLSSIGIGGGAVAAAGAGGTIAGGAAAGGGLAIGGKAAATALTVLAIGGGAVAVKHEAAPPSRQPSAAQRGLAVTHPVSEDPAEPGSARGRTHGSDGRGDGSGGDGSGHGGGKGSGPADAQDQADGESRGHRSPRSSEPLSGEREQSGESGRSRGGSGSDSGSDSHESSSEHQSAPEPAESGDDGEHSGSGSGGGSDDGAEDPSGDSSGPDSGTD